MSIPISGQLSLVKLGTTTVSGGISWTIEQTASSTPINNYGTPAGTFERMAGPTVWNLSLEIQVVEAEIATLKTIKPGDTVAIDCFLKDGSSFAGDWYIESRTFSTERDQNGAPTPERCSIRAVNQGAITEPTTT